jgi:zinc protease
MAKLPIYGWYETLGLGIEFDRIFQEIIPQITPKIAREVAERYLTRPYISILKPE